MKTLFTLLLITITTLVLSQEKDFTTGKVKTFSGKLVFEDLVPSNKYEIVFSFENLIKNYNTNSIETNWNESVKNAMMESGYQGGKPFDAIIINDQATRDIAIKFNSSEMDNSMASIGKRMEGVYVFIAGEPYYAYDHIATLKVKRDKYTSEEAYAKIIQIAKKKYGNFNGVIFSSTDMEKADLIKFQDLEITGGGFRVGDFAMHQDGRRPSYGLIASLDNTSQKAGFVYLDEYGEEKVTNIKYADLTKVDEAKYNTNLIEQAKEVKLHEFVIDEKVTWDNGAFYGKVIELDKSKHNAKVEMINEYGEIDSKSFDFLDIHKLEEAEYEAKLAKHMEEVAKHVFTIGEKVKFDKGGQVVEAEVTELNATFHKASLKYLDEAGEEKKANIHYFKIEKL